MSDASTGHEPTSGLSEIHRNGLGEPLAAFRYHRPGIDRVAHPLLADERTFGSLSGGFSKPYVGALLASTRLVVLGLDPGRYEPIFQAWDGILASGIRKFGSYSVWMATTPYLRAPWTKRSVPTATTRPGSGSCAAGSVTRTPRGQLVIFEAYPLALDRVTAAMKPPANVIDEFVW